MRYLVLVLAAFSTLGGCQSPTATAARPVTLLGHWQCDTVTSEELDRAGRPLGPPEMNLLDSIGLDLTSTRLLMTHVTPPGDTSEWVYTRRQDTLLVRCVRFQNRPDSSADVDAWRVAALTPSALVVERSYPAEEGMPNPVRIHWHYRRSQPRE